MVKFLFMSACGFVFTVYGTIFFVHSLTSPFYLVPFEPQLSGALLLLGFTFPIVGHYLTTESTESVD
jgi:hypothetical protein